MCSFNQQAIKYGEVLSSKIKTFSIADVNYFLKCNGFHSFMKQSIHLRHCAINVPAIKNIKFFYPLAENEVQTKISGTKQLSAL